MKRCLALVLCFCVMLPSLAMAQQAEASVKNTRATNRGLRRPVESESGPTKSCPRAMPSRQAVMVSWVVAVEMERSAAMAGRDSRARLRLEGRSLVVIFFMASMGLQWRVMDGPGSAGALRRAAVRGGARVIAGC